MRHANKASLVHEQLVRSRNTPAQEMLAHRQRVEREAAVHPYERREAEGSVLPKIGGARSMEEERLDGNYRDYRRRKLHLYSNEPAGPLLQGAATNTLTAQQQATAMSEAANEQLRALKRELKHQRARRR